MNEETKSAKWGSGLPMIPASNDAGSQKEIERAIRLAFTSILQTARGAEVIARFKTGETVTGHKVGGNIAAVDALVDVFGAIDQYAVIKTEKVLSFRKSQILDTAIRPWREIGKDDINIPGALRSVLHGEHRIMNTASFIDTIIQHDDQVWRVISTGVSDERGVYCHLASVHNFRAQKNGKVPYQIADFVPLAVLKRGRSV